MHNQYIFIYICVCVNIIYIYIYGERDRNTVEIMGLKNEMKTLLEEFKRRFSWQIKEPV